MLTSQKFISILCCLMILVSSCALTPSTTSSATTTITPIKIAPREQVETHGKKWMISTQGKQTTQIANQVMKSGGNLIDAAIAASFAISVERPHSTGLGGGGFLIYHEAKSGKNFVYDFRERAPALSKKDMYLDNQGMVIPDLSVYGALSVGTPGLVKGLSQIHKKFGKKSWKSLLKPARDLAKNGFKIYPSLAHALDEEQSTLMRYPSSKKIFLHDDGSVKKIDELLTQEDLAHTLEILSVMPEDFYSGKIASRIVSSVKKENGLLSAQDLKRYAVKERKAISAYWKDYEIVTMPPPSSGGIHVIQILKLLEKDSLHSLEPKTIHLTASAMQSAFADRAVYLGDPDFVTVPMKGLLSGEYLKKRRSEFNEIRARTKSEVSAGKISSLEEEENTTHFSMMDAVGNVVVSTQTINGFFGSGFVVDGTGIVLNNEMDDFSSKPGAANIFGAVGGNANAIAPLKTPLSSMSPTIVFQGIQPVLALGAPGGTRIITAVAQTILNHLVFKNDLYTSIATARIHQQWSPDVLTIENPASDGMREEVSSETIDALEKLGWVIKRAGAQSNVMAVSRIKGANHSLDLVGVSDPRDVGTSAGE